MRIFTYFILCLIASSPLSAGELVLENGWVRAAPPMVKNLAGYGVLRNTSSHQVFIEKMNSPLFQKVEAHKTSFVNGMMKMQHMEEIAIAAGKALVFEPSGMHFMLVKPKQPIIENLQVPLEITLRSGEVVRFTLIVKK